MVVTEKLDGGNCCLKGGEVFARTHAAPTRHPWFGTVKQMHALHAHTAGCADELYGENMTAVHSIAYGNLAGLFYLFGVRRAGRWLPWAEVRTHASVDRQTQRWWSVRRRERSIRPSGSMHGSRCAAGREG